LRARGIVLRGSREPHQALGRRVVASTALPRMSGMASLAPSDRYLDDELFYPERGLTFTTAYGRSGTRNGIPPVSKRDIVVGWSYYEPTTIEEVG